MMIHEGDCLCALGLWIYKTEEYEFDWKRVVQPLGKLDPNNWIVRKMIERGDIEPAR